MLNNNDNAAYRADIIRTRSRILFGTLLKIICKRAGITQDKLEEDSRNYCDYLLNTGYIHHIDEIGSLGQSAISRVINGSQPPTYNQVYIWMYVIRQVYESQEYKQACLDLDLIPNDFPRDLETDMYRLARFGTPEEIVTAYERRKDMPMEPILRRKKSRPKRYDPLTPIPFPPVPLVRPLSKTDQLDKQHVSKPLEYH
jgi:hypothetical protein